MEAYDINKIWNDDLALFPSLEQYKRQLDVLKTLSLDNTAFDSLYDKYFDLAVLLPQIVAIQTKENFNQQRFFRVRLNIDKTKENIQLIDTYSYPPAFLCKENGRGNLKGKSVFYCSNHPTCALFESKPKVGDIAHISIWKAYSDREIKIAICLPLDLKEGNRFQVMANEAWEFAKKHYFKEAKDKHAHFLALNTFLAERFVNENTPYFLTSWIADQILFNEQHWRDYILYPSIESNNNYCNMAFHPNTVTQYLRLEKVIRAKITSVIDKALAFNLGSVGEIDKTKINWRKATDIEYNLFADYGYSFTDK